MCRFFPFDSTMFMLTFVLAMYFFIAVGVMKKGRAVGFTVHPYQMKKKTYCYFVMNLCADCGGLGEAHTGVSLCVAQIEASHFLNYYGIGVANTGCLQVKDIARP